MLRVQDTGSTFLLLYRTASAGFSQSTNSKAARVETMFSENLLAGRRILVTGGGTGLGKSMASRFLQLGAEVHICGRRKSVCDETATELMDLYGGQGDSPGGDNPKPLAGGGGGGGIFFWGGPPPPP